MILLMVLLGFILLILMILIVAPFDIEIDTENQFYGMRLLWRMISVSFFWTPAPHLNFRIGSWVTKIDIKMKVNRNIVPSKPRKSRGKFKMDLRMFKRLRHVLKSFSVRRCELTIDTGDVVLNAQLYPVAYFISRQVSGDLRINYDDENRFRLEIRGSLAKMMIAFFKN